MVKMILALLQESIVLVDAKSLVNISSSALEANHLKEDSDGYSPKCSMAGGRDDAIAARGE